MEQIVNQLINFIMSIGIYGGILSSLILLVESILPVIPILVFITINNIIFGNFFGFIISYISLVIGCICSYMLFKYGFGNKFSYLIEDKEKIKKYRDFIKDISLWELILITSIPLTPAFIINIVCGICKTDFKKYLIAILIGKITLILYSGYIGSSLIESISNPIEIIKILILILIVYVIYKIVKKKFKL